MRNRIETLGGLLFLAVLVALVLTGCRAFQPESIAVNKAPETYIVGAPIEHGGGYYRFHVYWYGADEDGSVELFVWALTDTTVQDEDTTTDEEDIRFNPALDASTLEIASWTTRTDTVFNFNINQGVAPSADMTLHMVAVDDNGDYDRTPARLHFFSNTLGNPEIRFSKVVGTDTIPVASGQADTVGFGMPYTVAWAGSTPNIRGYTPEALAQVDTVFPYDDGLFGYKWKLQGALGGNCLSTVEDCWHPRKFNEATGDSFSYFGSDISLTFLNDGSSNTNPFRMLLPSGEVGLDVNSIDIAGVEVATFMREYNFVVNYDPQTILLNGTTDWAHPLDPEVYPYYIQLNDPAQIHHPFEQGDRIPDRTYVVFKALARDNPKDGPGGDPDFKIGIGGSFVGTRSNYLGGTFVFRTESSELSYDPTWGVPDGCDTCWYADTLGFLTGPNTEYLFNMQSVDVHGRFDGNPPEFQFEVGYPPGIQCVELLPKTSSTSGFGPDLEWYDPNVAGNPCFSDTTELRVTQSGLGPDELQQLYPVIMLVDKASGFLRIASSSAGQEQLNYVVPGLLYRMEMLLHGQDDPREAWTEPVRRMMGWKYQVGYECDIYNEIKDGGGNDDIKEPTWGEIAGREGILGEKMLTIDPVTGLWKISIDVAVPSLLISNGPDGYLLYLQLVVAGGDPDVAQNIFESTTRQFGLGTVQAVALDQTSCGFNPVRPGAYNYFKAVRPSVAELNPGQSWRDCTLSADVSGIQAVLDLAKGAMPSLVNVPAEKHFRITVQTSTGDFVCTQ